MSTALRRFKSLYGARPAHLLLHMAALAIGVYALLQILAGGAVVNYAAWFLGAAVLHDLVALPTYSFANLALERVARPRRADGSPGLLNYIRIPAMMSAVLFAVYFPLILGQSRTNYINDTGHPPTGYARNWLLITLGFYVVSALVYAVKRARGSWSP